MSMTDDTHECEYCGRTVPNGKRCSCKASRQSLASQGKPDGDDRGLLSGDSDGPAVEITDDLNES